MATTTVQQAIADREAHLAAVHEDIAATAERLRMLRANEAFLNEELLGLRQQVCVFCQASRTQHTTHTKTTPNIVADLFSHLSHA